MPLDRTGAIQLGILLIAVPLQFYIAISTYKTETQRVHALKSILTRASQYTKTYLSISSWKKWCVNLIEKVRQWKVREESFAKVREQSVTVDDEGGISPALEVLGYGNPKGYFAGSFQPRSPRPTQVKYHIGQVIRHKKWGYRGVIIGWDQTAQAPEEWLKQMHPEDKPHWRLQPNYSILVDTRDRPEPQTTYVPEENIEIVKATKVSHSSLDDYFEHFDGIQYLPRPWLKRIYPFG